MADAQFVADQEASIKVVSSHLELHEVRELRAAKYRQIYPSIDVHQDLYDEQAIILYGQDNFGRTNSTARLVKDGPLGLPEDQFFPPEIDEYRRNGKSLLELGRFIIDEGDVQLLKDYYRAFYNTAKSLHADMIIMAMKPKDVRLHQRLIGAELLEADMGVSYGGAVSLSCVSWDIANTKDRFFQWIGGVQ